MPSRNEAITALLAAQSKPVTPTESTPSRGTRQGLTSAGAPLSRVRDRMTVAENIPAPGQKVETWDDSVARRRREVLAEGERRRAQREREAAERKAAEDRKRWKAEEDARMLREMQQRTVAVIFKNEARREVRALLENEPAEIVEEVARRVKAAGGQSLPFVWSALLDEVKQEREQR